jgi:hypothetical protein
MRRITVFTLVFSAALVATVYFASRIGPTADALADAPASHATGLLTPF